GRRPDLALARGERRDNDYQAEAGDQAVRPASPHGAWLARPGRPDRACQRQADGEGRPPQFAGSLTRAFFEEKAYEDEHHRSDGGGGHYAHMVADFRERFWVSLVLSVPVLALAPLNQGLVGPRGAAGVSGGPSDPGHARDHHLLLRGPALHAGNCRRDRKAAARPDDSDRARDHGRLGLQRAGDPRVAGRYHSRSAAS